jgi:hypothetical protein
MENLTTRMADGNSDDEAGSNTSPSPITIGPTNLGSTTAQDSSKTSTATQLRDKLVKSTCTDNKKKTMNPPIWYRLVDVRGARWIFQNLEKVREYVTKDFYFAHIFESKAKALTWRSGGQNDPLQVPPTLIGDDDWSDDGSRNTARGRKDKKKKKKKPTRKSHERDKKSPGYSPNTGKRRKSRRLPTPLSSSSEDSSSSSDSDSSTDSEKSKRSK